jgi:membrane protein implicated in regulation of membrane protease activity
VNVSQWMPVVALVLGALVIVIGILNRRRGGYSQVLLGAALVIGPLSPLLKGRVPVPIQIAFSLAAVAFTVASVIVVFGRLRRAQR